MKPKNWPPHLRTVSDKLQEVELISSDFERVIDSMPDGSFVFVDPPYYDADQKKFYSCTFSEKDHMRLSACLRRHSERLSFLLTYDDHVDVRGIYKWAKSIDGQQWNYTINRTDDQKNGVKKKDGFRRKRYKGQEMFIRNYDV